MTDPILVWRSDHEYFRRLLATLQKEVDRFHAGERPNYELMLEVIAYLREFCDRVHHPAEDWAAVRETLPRDSAPGERFRALRRQIAAES